MQGTSPIQEKCRGFGGEAPEMHMMDVAHRAGAGWIEVVAGSMFSGKSEELIRRLRRAQIARQRVQIFKPVVDNRYGDGHIISHSAQRIESEAVASSRQLLEQVRPDTEVVGIELPPTVDLKVTDTAPGIKGATASAQTKPATCETGVVITVPSFINPGDIVRINTETGEYQGRA